MAKGWEYRVMSAAGTVVLAVLAVLIANHSLPQTLFTNHVPLFNRLSATVLTGSDLAIAVGFSTVIVFCCLIPLYKPRPRRILDTVLLTEKQALLAMFVIATIGYFDFSYRLPRATLVMAIGLLFAVLPTWFIIIRHQPARNEGQAIIVGDDPSRIEQAADAIEVPVLGYLSPPIITGLGMERAEPTPIADGGATERGSFGFKLLGGLSRLERIIVNYNVTTVVLAFSKTDRGEFFGVLETCHTHGVEAKVLREHADSVLLSEKTADKLVDVDVEPWDWQDRLLKRGFDVTFALAGITLFAPLLGIIAIAVRLDNPGPIFYSQERTTDLGGTFDMLKFRTMLPNSESADPVDDKENNQITRVGRLLRKSHLDELPQLWPILIGDMSVVGPRAVWTDEEALLEEEAVEWRKRWFVKPGLTGLAQINDVSSTDPEAKLRYDLEYIRRQSLRLDMKIVIRQIWNASVDVFILLRGNDPEAEEPNMGSSD